MTNAQATASLKAGFAEYLSLYGVEHFLTRENTALSMAAQYEEVDELNGLTIEEAAEIMQSQIDAAIELLGDDNDDDNEPSDSAVKAKPTEIFRINDKQWDYADTGLSLISVFAFMVVNKLKMVGENITYENGIKVYTIEVVPQSIG